MVFYRKTAFTALIFHKWPSLHCFLKKMQLRIVINGGFEQSCTPDQKERSMKMDPNYKIHEITGETIVVNQGGSQCEHDTHHLTGRIGTQALSDVGGAGLHGRGPQECW